MNRLKKLINITKDLTILYVEDDYNIRQQLSELFEKLFKHVFIDENGEAGLKRYIENGDKIDLIVTDINMPIMNGLEMIQKIKDVNNDINFIVTSAYGDSQYFTQAIELGVDRFILKPINTMQLHETLYSTVSSITNKKLAEFYTEHLEKRVAEEIEKNMKKTKESLEMLSSLIEAYPNPVIAFKKNKVSLVNRRFCEIFSIKDVDNFINRELDLDRFLIQSKGTDVFFEELIEEDLKNNIVSIKTNNGRKIFRIVVTKIFFPKGEEDKLYTFNDITVEEYQKQKIKNYSERLEDLILFKRKNKIFFVL